MSRQTVHGGRVPTNVIQEFQGVTLEKAGTHAHRQDQAKDGVLKDMGQGEVGDMGVGVVELGA